MKLWNWEDGLTPEELESYMYGWRALRPEPVTECAVLVIFALPLIATLLQ